MILRTHKFLTCGFKPPGGRNPHRSNYSIKLLLYNYNIQNNLTTIIIYRKMKWRWKGTYIEAGEFGGGHEQIIIINRAGGTYKWMKVGNRAGWVRFVWFVVSGNGWWCGWLWCGRRWWCRLRGGGVGGSVCVCRG